MAITVQHIHKHFLKIYSEVLKVGLVYSIGII